MNKTVVAGAALLAGIAIASPLAAWSADSAAQTAQPAAPSDQPGGMGGMDNMRGMGGMEHGGMMGHRAGRMHEMMMRRMGQLSPRQRCEERLAHRAGVIAYTVAKLNLTAQQKPLWDKLNGQLQASADKERQLCQSLPQAAGQQTILDRVGEREQFLAARLQGLQQVRPALEQFYQALTADQKAIVDHPFKRG
jgi:LTXXQ motif family protein